MCFHQNRSLSTRAKGRGHTQQSQGRFHPECAISATAMRCVWPAGPRTISAHAGGTLFPGFQARVPFLPRLTSHGVMPTLQVEGLLREPGRHLSRFANLSFTFLGPLPSAGRPSQHSARSFIPLGLTWGRLRAQLCTAESALPLLRLRVSLARPGRCSLI